MTQEALAHDAGVTVSHLSLIERGNSNPTWETIRRIASALDTTISRIADLADEHADRDA